jgi:hypothetical protein
MASRSKRPRQDLADPDRMVHDGSVTVQLEVGHVCNGDQCPDVRARWSEVSASSAVHQIKR